MFVKFKRLKCHAVGFEMVGLGVVHRDENGRCTDTAGQQQDEDKGKNGRVILYLQSHR